MKSDYAIGADDIVPFKLPELSDYQCFMFGGGRDGLVYRPRKENTPNWFWRKMQYICFGNRWVKD